MFIFLPLFLIQTTRQVFTPRLTSIHLLGTSDRYFHKKGGSPAPFYSTLANPAARFETVLAKVTSFTVTANKKETILVSFHAACIYRGWQQRW
jgi:hypothetical protein